MEKTSFLFNDTSKAYWQKLTPMQQKSVEKNFKEATEKVQALDTDYRANKDKKIADEEKRLTQEYKKQFNMPRPKGFLAPRLLTAAEIRSEADDNVRNAYTKTRQAIIKDHREKERNIIGKALGIHLSGQSHEHRISGIDDHDY